MTAFSDETGRDWLPLKYEDGPDFCAVTFATGAAFALTVHPERMKLMEAALSASPVAQEPVAYVPIHPRSGPLWMDTFPANADVSESRSASYERRALYTSPPAAPVVQEPVADTTRARMHADRIRWLLKNDPDGLAFALEMHREARSIMETLDELIANPPVTPAGLGADEIARDALEEAHKAMLKYEASVEPEFETPIFHREMMRKIERALALLSRAGDQK